MKRVTGGSIPSRGAKSFYTEAFLPRYANGNAARDTVETETIAQKFSKALLRQSNGREICGRSRVRIPSGAQRISRLATGNLVRVRSSAVEQEPHKSKPDLKRRGGLRSDNSRS